MSAVRVRHTCRAVLLAGLLVFFASFISSEARLPPVRPGAGSLLGGSELDASHAMAVTDSGSVWLAGGTGGLSLGALEHREILLARIGADGTSLERELRFGGRGEEHARAIDIDGSGRVWLCGETASADFPKTLAGWSSIYQGQRHSGFISRHTVDGELEWASYVGGEGRSRCSAIKVNADGSGYLAGETTALSLPKGNITRVAGNGSVAYVMAWSTTGEILWSRFIDGSAKDAAISLVEIGDNLWLGGWTESTDLPTTDTAWQRHHGGRRDGFIGRLSKVTGALEYLSYIGGSGIEEGVLLSGSGQSLWFAGVSNSASLFVGLKSDVDIYAGQWRGAAPLWSRVYGGSHRDKVFAIEVGSGGDLWLTGMSYSGDFPLTADAAQVTRAARRDAIVLRVSAATGELEYASYLGGTGRDDGYAVRVAGETVWVSGVTFSADFPGTVLSLPLGSGDAFVRQYDQSNRKPTIISEPQITARIGQAYTYALTAVDADADLLHYRLQVSPDGMEINRDSGLIRWTPATAATVNVTAQVTDSNGGTASQSFTLTVTEPDAAAPVIRLSAPEEGFITNQPQQTLIGSLDGSAALTVNGTPLPLALDNSFSTTITLTEGPNTFNFSATDAAGNVGTAQLNLVLDTIAPGIHITTPLEGSRSNQVNQLIAGSISEAATLWINGQAVPLDADNQFSTRVSLNEGPNTFNFSATDAAGNTATRRVQIDLDTVPPELMLATPVDGSLSTNSRVNFRGRVSEAVSLFIDGQAVITAPDYRFNAVLNIAEGVNEVAIIATDRAGNRITQSVTITIDSIAPGTPLIDLIQRGNPLNGVVMVTGLVGAAEPGSLVHIVNPTTDYEALVLARSDGSFSSEVAGFANDTLSLFAVDAAGNISPTAVLPADLPLALNLDLIGNKLVPLGQTTRFTVTANDREGNPISLGLTPLPLPAGMDYNIANGEFSFKPSNGQEGVYRLTFSALSGAERVTERVTITVPAVLPTAPTDFTGRVLDANSFAKGDLIPVVGASIRFLGSDGSTTTDSEGYFTLRGLPETAAIFDIDTSTAQAAPGGAGYGSFREQLRLVRHVLNREERPFYLPRLATASMTQVNPSKETVVNNTDLGIRLRVPPNTAMNADGTPFVGQLSISEVPRQLAPANLPESLDPSLLFTIQPVGVVYQEPVPITLTNKEGFAPGSEVDLWSIDPDLGAFVIVGTGQVSADGSEITTIAGGIRANDWHTLLPLEPDTPPCDPSTMSCPSNKDKPCPTCPDMKGASTFSLNDGNMGLKFSLQPYRSLEASRALTFSYRSFRAYPRPAIVQNGRINGRSVVPQQVSYALEVAGLKQGREVFVDTSGFAERVNEDFTVAIAFDAADFSSGMYAYQLKITSNFRDGFGNISSRGGSGGGPRRGSVSLGSDGSRRSVIIEGDIMVVNGQASAFGAGWMLEGLYHLAFNQDHSVTMIAPNGNSINYNPPMTAATTSADLDAEETPTVFIAPDSDYATFVRNPDGTYTHLEKDGIKLHFNAQGQLTRHEDRNSNIMAYAYDSDGKLLTITDPVGLITTFAYDHNGLLETVVDPANRRSRFEHDAVGNLIKMTYPDATSRTFAYDERHLITAHTDERGNRYTDRYDRFGRIIDGTLPDGTVRAASGQNTTALVDVSSGIGQRANPAPVTRPTATRGVFTDGRGHSSGVRLDRHGRATMAIDELGRTTMHERDADSNPTRTTRPIGSVVSRTFDALGNVLQQTEEFNQATMRYTYDRYSLLTRMTNPRGNTLTMMRDLKGNVLKYINALGHTTTMAYNAQGLPTKTTTPNNLLITYTYNEQGLMTAKTETPPDGSPGAVRNWHYQYYPTGLLQRTTTPDGITLHYEYDPRSLLTRVTDNLNQQIVYHYDARKNLIRTETRSSDGSLALLVNSLYDNRNRLLETSMPHVGTEESTARQILDPNSNVIGMIDPNGNSSRNHYDAFNRLVRDVHREDGVAHYRYDAQDRMIEVTAANGVVTRYEYDIIGRRIKAISQDQGTITYTFDQANNITSMTDGRGITANLRYDALERVITKRYPNTIANKDESVTYTYDNCAFGKGYLCRRLDESGVYNYTYDSFGNLTQQRFTHQGQDYNTAYRYDAGDNILQLTYPSGRVVAYTRDGIRRLTGINTRINNQPQVLVSDIRYRGDNQLLQYTYGNGLQAARRYDLQGRLQEQSLKTPQGELRDQRGYRYDKNSNIVGIDRDQQNLAYSYDRLDRIEKDLLADNPPIAFSYDLNDNRLLVTRQAGRFSERLAYVMNSNQLLTRTALQQGVGLPSSVSARDLIYNDAGRLYQLAEQQDLLAEYLYNDMGQRIGKTVYQQDGITVGHITLYHYDQMGRLISETTTAGQVIKDYVYNGLRPVAQIDVGRADDAVGITGTTETVSYLYSDHLMTTRLASDQSQAIIWRWQGEAFGNTPAIELATIRINLRFPGQYYDEETNLHYNHFRYYDPSLGRYITSDPIGLEGGMNTYGYVKGNPVRFVDPKGLFRWHGNWGGPGWAAGRKVAEKDLRPEDFNFPVRDGRDACYRDHDICIFHCENTDCASDEQINACIRQCDYMLALCLIKIPFWDIGYWGTDRGVPLKARTEALAFGTFIPQIVHRM